MGQTILRRWLLGLVMAVVGFTAGGLQVRAQGGGCGWAGANPVACENLLAGNPASEWDVPGVGDPSIQGFATDISVDQGQTVRFKVSTSVSAYRIDIYRLGYYNGLGARKVATVLPSATLPQTQPACLTDPTTGLVDCGNWAESASWAVPSTATSGIYIARLVRSDTGGASHMVFIVRDDDGGSALLFQTSDTTWQAYNSYGGNSFYVGSPGSPAGRAYKLSYNRPFNNRPTPSGPQESWLFNAEYPMVRWLEANGYDVSYTTGVDTDRRGAELLEHRVFMSVGHDEYWSAQQRTRVEAARDAGVNLAFFSGNEVFWKTRWESSIAPGGATYRTLVSYKETHANAKIDPTSAWTGTWRDPRFSPDGGRPENALTGQLFMVNAPRNADAITVPAAQGKMRFWRNTSIANLTTGQTATLPAGTLGYEWDEAPNNGWQPAGLMRLSTTTINVSPVYLLDYGSTYGSGTATHSLTLYRHSSGALVFGAGTVQWSWGLDATHDRAGTPSDSRMQQATVNLFADMGVQPFTPASGIITSPGSTDTAAPTTVISAPANGATVSGGQTVVISGTAADTGGGIVAAVEVSTDNGVTWQPATGTTSWSYSWLVPGAGSAPVAITIKARATDDSGNTPTTPPSIGVTISPGAGPVAAYAFNEGTGTSVSDNSGTGNNGTIAGPTWSVSGRFGGALVFDGVDDLVNVADSNSLDLSAAMTLEAWVYPFTLSGFRTVLFKERPNAGSYILYAHDGAPRPSSYVFSGSERGVQGTTALTPNTWTHLAASYDGAVMRLYVNGALVSSSAITGAIAASTNPLRIGGNTIWGEYFNGVIDEVRIYNRSLGQFAIQSDMNTPVGGTPLPPDTTPPTVSITAPANGATVSGIVNMTANAADVGTGIAGVQFRANGNAVGPEAVTAPYASSWDTTLVANGTYALTAVARDLGGNSTTSATINVTVANSTTTPFGLVAAYSFNEGTGTTVNDTSGRGNTGTISGAAAWTTSGRYGGALTFDGVDDIVNVPDSNTLDLTTGMTLEAWVYPTTLSGWRTVIMKETPTAGAYILYAHDEAPRPAVYIRTPNESGAIGTGALALNTWSHLATTYDGATLRLFVNGVQVGSQGIAGAMTTSTNPLRIGANAIWGERFAGRIDDVRIYNRALSTAELTSDMNTGLGGGVVPPRLVITAPANGASISGASVPVSYTTTGDLTEVNHVHFVLDGNPEVMDLTFDGAYQFVNVPAGSHTLNGFLVRADHSKIANTDATPVTFTTVATDTTPPTVSITAPAGGSTVSGIVNLTATAADVGSGVAGVQFRANNSAIGSEDTTSPYGVSWDTTIVANGTYSLTAVARDIAGNTTTSTAVSVTVSNAAPPVTGLVAAYSFNEGTGTVLTDTSGRGNNGTIAGGAAWTTSGKNGGALTFDGVDDIVNIPDSSSLDLTTGMTLQAWVYPTTLSGWRTVVMKETTNAGAYILYAHDNSPRPAAYIHTSTEAGASGSSALALNTWSHLAVTYDGATLRLFVNGTQVGSQGIVGSIQTSSNPLRIGANTIWGERFAGRIDDVRIYNRALSTAELTTDMNNGVSAGPPRAIITTPANGAIVAGTTVNVAYTSTGDLSQVSHIHFRVDNGPEVMDVTFDGAYQLFDIPAGTHTLQAFLVRADHSKIDGSDATPVTFTTTTPDTTPPSVSITNPTGGTVSGTITVTASASDNIGVTAVRFLVDGSSLGPDDTTAPYSISWNTAIVLNGTHSITAIAFDGSANQTTSTAVTVTTSNGSTASQVGSWGSVMNWPLVAVHSTLLHTGEVLMWDGWEVPTALATLWNPTTNTFTPVTVDAGIFCSAHSMLPDGRLLVVGGHTSAEFGIRDTKIFNPVTRSWSTGPNMATARWYPSATTLPDGRVITISGQATPGVFADNPEIYNPSTNAWQTLGVSTSNMHDPEYPLPFLLPNGRLYVIGAAQGWKRQLDLSTNTWINDGTDSRLLNVTAVMYRPGKILATGGGTLDQASQTKAAMIDMTAASPAWTNATPMNFARYTHNLVMLPDGNVLAVGGATVTSQLSSSGVLPAEMWNPTNNTWTTMAAMTSPRMYHSTAVLLPDARVLVAGGGRKTHVADPASDYLSGQVYSPPYLFKGARPTITSAPSTIPLTTTFTVQTPDAASISSVSLIRLTSITHTLDMDQHFIPLTFTAGSGQLTITGPGSTGSVRPGYYMLFIVNNQGVPSTAAMVQLPVTAPPPPPPPPTGGLVAAYGFNENTGVTTADATGLSGAGTISGATWAATGRFGSALSFNGTSSSVVVPDGPSLDLATGMTIEAWVNPTALSGWRTVMMKEAAGGLAYGLYAHDNAPRPATYINNGSQEFGAIGTSQLPLNTWTHMAVTYDGATLRLFVNGTQVGSQGVVTSMQNSSQPFRVGGNAVWGEWFSGMIDEVRVYNRALTATEIQTDMTTPVAP